MQINKKRLTDIYILILLWLLFLFIFSLADIVNPALPKFDWYNYRAYNCWAFLNGRLPVDFFAANIRTCINPIINLPEYFLMMNVKNFYLSTILENLDLSLLMVFVYKIIAFVLKEKSKLICVIITLFCIAYIVESPMLYVLSPIGGRGDVLIALLCLIGFYYLIKNIFNAPDKKKNIFILLCGGVFGLAMGLKYTTCVFFITVALIFLILRKYIPRPWHSLTLFVIGGITTFFFSGGLWMIYCYNIYHNPVFPYFNDIFKSEYVDFVRVHNTDYKYILPKNIFAYIFYAFQMPEFPIHKIGYDENIREYRWAISYILIALIYLYTLIEKYIRAGKKKVLSVDYFINLIEYKYLYAILLFITISYFINTALFGTYRYIFADYCLFGLIVYIFAEILFKKFMRFKKFLIVGFCILVTIFVYIKTDIDNFALVKHCEPDRTLAKTARVSVYKNKNLKFKDDSKVLILNDCASIAAVGQNKNVQYVGFALPNDMYDVFLEEKNKYEFGAFFLISDKIAKLNEEIILSDDFIQVLYLKEYNGIDDAMKVLEMYNSKRKNPRKLTNCYNAGVSFYGVTKNYYNIYRCNYN